METKCVYVNETNHAPLMVELVGPPGGTLVSNFNEMLVWYPTTDPDAGDAVVSYHLQADDDASFASPEINATNIVLTGVPTEPYWAAAAALGELPGGSNLVAGSVYFWRVRARDSRDEYSAWSTPLLAFQFGIAQPQPATVTAIHRSVSGMMTIQWSGAVGRVFVEFSYTLDPTSWHTIAGPLPGTNWTFAPLPGASSGFYRLRCE